MQGSSDFKIYIPFYICYFVFLILAITRLQYPLPNRVRHNTSPPAFAPPLVAQPVASNPTIFSLCSRLPNWTSSPSGSMDVFQCWLYDRSFPRPFQLSRLSL